MLHQKLARLRGRGGRARASCSSSSGSPTPARRRIGTMSKGMQQRLGLAQALIGSPRMLLLDEPTSALDPAGRRTVRALLEELRGRGVSVLLNSHLLSEVELVCDRVAIIARGAVVAAGTPAELSHARRGGGRDRERRAGCSRDATPRRRAADRARAGGGGRGGLRRARADLHAGGRLSGGGGGPMNQVRIIAAFTLRESLRRRVFLVVALLTLAFLGLYALGTWQLFDSVGLLTQIPDEFFRACVRLRAARGRRLRGGHGLLLRRAAPGDAGPGPAGRRGGTDHPRLARGPVRHHRLRRRRAGGAARRAPAVRRGR